MTVFYLDTSAIVKRYRGEKGADVMHHLFDDPPPEDRFYTSFLSVLELTSSIVRLARSSQLSQETAGEILARFRLDTQKNFRLLPLDDEVGTKAVSIVEDHGLRSADAIHMATAALIFAGVSGIKPALVSSDRELLQAAKSGGMETLDPTEAGSIEALGALRDHRLKQDSSQV